MRARWSPAAEPAPATSPWSFSTLSLQSFSFPKSVGNRFWRPGLVFGENLRFPTEDIQCCLGVKRKEPGANWRSLPGDCSHLGRQTENETAPLTPEIFLNAGSVGIDPAPHRLAKVRCVCLKSSHGVQLHLRFGRRN